MRYLPLLLAALLPLPALAADPAPAATAAVPAVAPPVAVDPAAAPADATAVVEAPPSWVYLVARVKLKDTDITQVSFLRHPEVTTMEACEAERAAGLMSGWRYFNRHYFRTLKGISYVIDFRCVTGTQYLAPWRKGELQNRHYLVTTTDATLQVEAHESFFACRRALRQTAREESIDRFCGTASQAILPAPVKEAEIPEAPEPASDGAPAAAPLPVASPAQPAPASQGPRAPAVPAPSQRPALR